MTLATYEDPSVSLSSIIFFLLLARPTAIVPLRALTYISMLFGLTEEKERERLVVVCVRVSICEVEGFSVITDALISRVTINYSINDEKERRRVGRRRVS